MTKSQRRMEKIVAAFQSYVATVDTSKRTAGNAKRSNHRPNPEETEVPQKSKRWFEIDRIMSEMPLRQAVHWCNPGDMGCACLGCANNSGGLARAGITREEWAAYMVDLWATFNPKSEHE